MSDFSTLLIPVALSPQQLVALQACQGDLRILLPDQGLEVAARIYRVNPGFDTQTREILVDITLTEPLVDQRGGLRAIPMLRDCRLPPAW